MPHQDEQTPGQTLPPYLPQQGGLVNPPGPLPLPPKPGLPLAPRIMRGVGNALQGFGFGVQGREAPYLAQRRHQEEMGLRRQQYEEGREHREMTVALQRQQLGDALYEQMRKIRDDAEEYPEGKERSDFVQPHLEGMRAQYNRLAQGTPLAGGMNRAKLEDLLTQGRTLEAWRDTYGEASPAQLRDFHRMRRDPKKGPKMAQDYMEGLYKGKKDRALGLVEDFLGKELQRANASRGEQGALTLGDVQTAIDRRMGTFTDQESRQMFGITKGTLREVSQEFLASARGQAFLEAYNVSVKDVAPTGLESVHTFIQNDPEFAEKGYNIKRWKEIPPREWAVFQQRAVATKAAEREKELEAEKRAITKAGLEVQEQTIATAKDRAEHVDPEALMKRGQLVLPPAGVRNIDLKSKYVYMSDRQKKGWGELMQARSALDTMNALNDQIIVAETPREAAKQAANLWLGGLSRWNPTATSILAASEAITSGLAKTVGPETGVLTSTDVKRWQAAVTASFFDTKDVKEIKKAIMEDFYGAVHRAAVAEIVGTPATFSMRTELQKTLSRLERASKVVVIRNPQTKEYKSGPRGAAVPKGWEMVTEEGQ